METDQDEQATSAGRESENMTLSTATEQITSEAIAEFNNMPQELHKAAKSAKFSESELQERRSFKDHDGSEIASTDTSLPTDDTVCFDEQQMGHLQNVGNLAEPIRKDSVDKDGHCRDDRLVVLTDVFDAANAALRAMEEEISEKTKELSIQETSIEYKENENLSEKTAGFPDECVSEYDLNNADSLEAVLKTDQIISEEITRRAQEEFEAKNRRTGRTYPMPTQNILDEVVYFQDSTTINPNTTAQQQAPGIEEYHVDRAENGRPNVRSEENSEGAVIKTHKGEADFITASTEEPRMDIVSTEQVSMQNNPQENTGNRSTTVTEMNSMNITQPYEVTNIASGNKNGMNLQDEDASAQAQKTFSSATMAAEECSNLDEEQSQMEQTERQAEITGTELECEHDELLVCQSTSNPRESDDGEGHSITSVAESEQADSAVAEIATKSEADMSFGDEVSSNDAIFEKTTMQTQQSVQTAICEDKSNGKRMLEGEHEEALKRMSDENIETLFDSYFADHGCIKMMVATMREKGVGDEILTNNGEHIIEYGEQSSHLLKKSAELGSTPASELTMHSMSHHFDEVNHSGEVTAEELEYREETCNTDNLPVSSNEMESIANTAAVRSETFPQHETFAEPEFESDLMNCEQVNTEKSSCMSPSADCREDMTLATQNAPYGMPPDFNGTETDDVGVEHIGNDGSKELDRHPKHNEFPLLQPMLDEQQGHQEESVDDDIRRQDNNMRQEEHITRKEEGGQQLTHDQSIFAESTTEQNIIPQEVPVPYVGEAGGRHEYEQPIFPQPTAEQGTLTPQSLLYPEHVDEQLKHEQSTMAQPTAEQGIVPQEQPLAHTEEQLTSPQAMIQEDIIPQDQPLPHVEEEDEQMRHDQATIPKPTTEQDMRPQEKPTFCPGEGNEQIKREQPTFAQRTAERDVILQEQPPLYREEEDEHSERGNEQLKHEQPTFAQSMAEQGIIPQEKPLDHTEQQLASPQGTALQGNILPSVQPLPYSDERNEQLTYDQATSSLPAAQQDIMPQPMYCPAGRDEQLEHEQLMLPQLQEDIVSKEQHLPYSEEGEEHLKHDQSIFPQADEDEQHVHQDEGGDNGMKWVDIVPQTLPMCYKGEEEMTALHGVAQKAQYPIEEHTEVEGQNKSDEHESEQRSFRLSYLSSMKPNTNANVLQWESDAFLMDEKKLLSEVERKNEIGEDPSARKQWHYDGSENLEETDKKEAHFEQRASEFGEDRLVTEKPASVVSQVKPIEDENPSSRPQSQLETTGDVSDIKAAENHRREEVVEKKRDITPDSLNQSPHVDVRKRTDVVESGKDKNKLSEHIPSRREKSDVSGARVPTGAKQLISNKKQNERATMGEALSKTHDQKEMRMSNLVKKQRATAMSNSAVNSSETSSHKVEKPLPRTSLEKIPASKVRQRAADNSKRTPTAYVRTSMKPPVPRKPQRKSGSVENKDAKGSFIAGTGSPEIKAEKVGEKSGGSECKSVKKTPVKVSICEPIVWVETFVPTFEAVWVALLPQDDDIMGAMKNSNECIGPTTRSEVNGIKKAHTATTPETTQKTSGCLQEALRNESISQEEMKFPAVPEESELAIEQIGEGDVLIVSSKETVEVSEEPSSSQHDVISAQESEAIEDSDRTIGRNLTIEAGEKDGKSEGTFPVDKTFFSPKASPHSRAPLESVSRGTSSNSEAPFESSLIAEPHHKDLGSAPIVNDSAELPPQLKDFQSNTSHSAMVDRFVEERSKQILLGNITASNESAGQNTLTEEVNGNIETALSEHYPETLTSTHNRCSDEGISDRRSSGENDGLTTKEEEVAMNAIAIATEAEQLQNEKEKEAINDEKSEEKPSRPRQHGRGQFRGTMMCEQEDWKQSNGRQDSKQKPLQTVEGDGYVNHSQQSSQHKSKKRSRRSGKGHK